MIAIRGANILGVLQYLMAVKISMWTWANNEGQAEYFLLIFLQLSEALFSKFHFITGYSPKNSATATFCHSLTSPTSPRILQFKRSSDHVLYLLPSSFIIIRGSQDWMPSSLTKRSGMLYFGFGYLLVFSRVQILVDLVTRIQE